MCEAFEQNDQPTTLVHPSRGSGMVSFTELNQYYGLDTYFQVQTIPSFAGKNSIPNVPTSGEVGIASWLVGQLLRGRISSDDIIYSRNIVSTYALIRFCQYVPFVDSPTILYEQHRLWEDMPLVTETFYDGLDGVVCIAERLKQEICRAYRVLEEKIFVAHDGVNLDRYAGISKEEARRTVEIPLDQQIVMYTGHLYSDKQVEQLVQAAPAIPASVYVVGGYEEDIERLRKQVSESDSVTFTGFVSPSDIPLYQIAADVLVATADPAAQYYSPLKLFEYMAAEKPIVATRTPAFEEVLNDGQNSLLYEDGNVTELAQDITSIFTDPEVRETLIAGVSKTVSSYSWRNRASKIIDFIS